MSARVVYFLNGPNANLYGLDKQGVHTEAFSAIEARCRRHADSRPGIRVDFRQSNHEGVLIDRIQEARQKAEGLIINGAGLTYTSVTILDVLMALEKTDPGSAHEQHLQARAVPPPLLHLQGGDRHRGRARHSGYEWPSHPRHGAAAGRGRADDARRRRLAQPARPTSRGMGRALTRELPDLDFRAAPTSAIPPTCAACWPGSHRRASSPPSPTSPSCVPRARWAH